jgi:hypothetical protein
MTDGIARLLRKGIDHVAGGRTLEEYMGQVDATSLSSAEREELQQLLDMSGSLLQLRQIAIPSPRAKAANRTRFLGQAVQQKERRQRPAARARLRVPAKLQRALVGVTLSVVLLLVVGSGAATAAGGSLPGSALYPLKLVFEDTRLTLTFSQPARAQLYMRYASERTAEIVRLATAGRAVDEAVLARMAQQLQGATDAAESAGGEAQRELLEQVIQISDAQQALLSGASMEAPPEAQAALNAGATVAEQASRQAQEALQGLLPHGVTPTPAWTSTSAPAPSEPPAVAPVDSPTPRPSHTPESPTPSGTPHTATPSPTGTLVSTPTSSAPPAQPGTPGAKPTRTPGLTHTPVTIPGTATATPSGTPQVTHTPQAVFRVTIEDNPDPVPASYRIHYVVCAVNDGDVPLTNVVIVDRWSPGECVYLPPDNPSEIRWDIGTVEPHTRGCGLFALSTYSICGGRTVVNEAIMTCDQGTARAVEHTSIAGTPTPTRKPTTTATIAPTLTPTVVLTPTSTVTPTVAATPTSTVTPTVAATPTSTLTPTLAATPTSTLTPTIALTATSTSTPTVALTPTSALTPMLTLAPATRMPGR